MGAWIEIDVDTDLMEREFKSHPSWVRGLKYVEKEVTGKWK